jgi:DNA-binding GntR family transcriptional regulator
LRVGYVSPTDLAYRKLKKMIVSRGFSPRQKLLFSDLERMLGMSKTPISAALTRLVDDGLVEHIKYRGYFVADLDLASLDVGVDVDESPSDGALDISPDLEESPLDDASAVSLNQNVYTRIKDLILNSELSTGQKLIYADLEEKLGVSKTPITSALVRLESDGFVYRKQNAGYYVRNIKADEMHEMLEARIKIEVANIDFVISNITNNDLDKLEELSRIHKAYLPDHYDKKKSQNNIDFHLYLARIGRNRFMIRYIEHLYSWLSLEGRYTVVPSSRIVGSGLEHDEILEALRQRDSEQVKILMEKHLRGPVNDLLNKIRNDKLGGRRSI